MPNTTFETQLHIADMLTQNEWYQRDVALRIREEAGEVDPTPYIDPLTTWMSIIGQGGGLRKYATQAYETGKLEEQEAILKGRNRLASEEQKTYIWLAAGGFCTYCSVKVVPWPVSYKGAERMHVDHLNPWMLGGDSHLKNLGCSCKTCNQNKSGTMMDDQYRTVLKEMSEDQKITLAEARFVFKREYGR